MADIFVSYAREDRELAVSFVELLESQGWSVWWDRNIGPGSSFSKVIEKEIATAKCVIVLWTSNSVQSDWVNAEATEGLSNHKLIPVLLEDVELPLVFRMTQSSNLVGWPKGQFDEVISQLLTAVGSAIDQPVVIEPQRTRKKSIIPALLGLTVVVVLALSAAYFLVPSVVQDERPAAAAEQSRITSTEPIKIFVGEIAGVTDGVTEEIASKLDANPGLRVSDVESHETRYSLSGVRVRDQLVVSIFDNSNQRIRKEIHVTVKADELQAAIEDVVSQVARTLDVSYQKSVSHVDNETYLMYLAVSAAIKRYSDVDSRIGIVKDLEEIIGAAPRFPEAIAAMCRVRQQEFDDTGEPTVFTEAEKYCLRALRLDNENSQVLTTLGILYVMAGQYEEADRQFEAALSLSPYLTSARVGRASVMRLRGDIEGAIRLLQQSIELEPQNWNLYRDLASLYFGIGRFGDAAEQYEHVLMLKPDEHIVYNDLGAAYFMLEDFERAIKNWEKALSETPHYSALSNLGSAYYFEGNFRQALATYQRAIELNDTDYRLWLNAGEAAFHIDSEDASAFYLKSKEFAEARLEINPDDGEVLSALALCNASVGDDEAARKYISSALELSGNDIYVLYDIAVAHARLGDVVARDEMLARMEANGYSKSLIEKDANFR